MTDIYLHISAGRGPRECEWVVARLASGYAKEAKTEGLAAAVIYEDDAPGSCLLRLSGRGVERFTQNRIGTVRWVGQSPFRKNHKRKNWFVNVSLAPRLEDIPDLLERDITYQTLKASGPGGQHINATESAVRATHMPTGISVTAREERSQHANKRLCRAKLAAHFTDRAAQVRAGAKAQTWQAHNTLERGNEIRIYRGPRFKLES